MGQFSKNLGCFIISLNIYYFIFGLFLFLLQSIIKSNYFNWLIIIIYFGFESLILKFFDGFLSNAN